MGGGSYTSAKMYSVYSTALGDWATGHLLERGGGGLHLCRDVIGVFYSPSGLSNYGRKELYWRQEEKIGRESVNGILECGRYFRRFVNIYLESFKDLAFLFYF